MGSCISRLQEFGFWWKQSKLQAEQTNLRIPESYARSENDTSIC